LVSPSFYNLTWINFPIKLNVDVITNLKHNLILFFNKKSIIKMMLL